MDIRNADMNDLEHLLDMMEDFNRIEGIQFQREPMRAALRRLLDDGNLGRVVIAVLDGERAGYAVITWGYDLEFGGRDAFLTELYLRPERRAAGLGKRFIGEVEAVARAHGVHALHLGVRPDNAPALAVYRGAGFRPWTRLLFTKLLD